MQFSWQAGPEFILNRSYRRRIALMRQVKNQVETEAQNLVDYIISTKLSGQILNRQSGALQESVKPVRTTISYDTIYSGVVAANTEESIHGLYFEKGGTKTYDIIAARGHALAFLGKNAENPNSSIRSRAQSSLGSQVVVAAVRNRRVPKLPWFQVSFDEKEPEMAENIKEAAIAVLEELG